jgi:tetratricopeptide (TPR) repeat protein
MTKHFERSALHTLTAIALPALLAACGGGGGGEPAAPAVDPATGDVIRTSSGGEVSEAAMNYWNDGERMFAEAEEQGWTPERCSGAREQFREANRQNGGTFVEAIYMQGVVAERCGEPAEAQRFYTEALGNDESFCRARVGIGVQALREGNTQPARAAFERAIRDDPRCTSAYVNLAIIQRAEGTEESRREALGNLRRALAIESDYLPAFNQLALLYYDLAEGNRDMLDLAGVVCRQAQLIDEDYAPIYNTWGLIKVRQEDIVAALRLFQRSFVLDDSIYEAYMNFGALTLSYRGYEDARQAFTRATELRPDSYDATIGLGAALRGLARIDEAQAAYERAREMDATRPESYFNLGLIYQSYKDGSVASLRRAQELYREFAQRAGTDEAYARQLEDVNRTCRRLPQRVVERRRRHARRTGNRQSLSPYADDCRPGRIQAIDDAIELMAEMEQMQREAEEMQREAERMQQEMTEQQGSEGDATAPAEGEAPAEEGGTE